MDNECYAALCDGGCGRRIEPLPVNDNQANIVLLSIGWTVVGDKCFCPECWNDPKNEKVKEICK